jgi:hypothetical protein
VQLTRGGGHGGQASGRPAQSSDPNPLAGVRFYVDADTPAWEQWRAYERSGQQDKADLIWKIAREPRALWLGRFNGRTSTSRCGAGSTPP